MEPEQVGADVIGPFTNPISPLPCNVSGRPFVAYPQIKETLYGTQRRNQVQGNPMTLLGNELKVGSPAPDFTVHYFEGGLKTITKQDLLGKPTILSVVPSVDTGVAQFKPSASIKSSAAWAMRSMQ